MTEEERIFKGILFSPGAPELKAIKLRAHNLSSQYSRTFEDQTVERKEILEQLLGRMGEHSFIKVLFSFITGFTQKSEITSLATTILPYKTMQRLPLGTMSVLGLM